MSPDLERLIELQRLESAIADAKRLVASGPELRLAADTTLATAQQVVDDARHRAKDGQDARRALEKEAAVFQGRLSKFKDQLSAVKTNREYTAMQHEISSAETELRAVEDRELEIMVAADTIAAEVKAAEAALATRKKEVDAEKKQLDATVAATEASLAGLTAQRDALVAGLAPGLVALFDQVAQKRKGVAVSPTSDGLCALCHVRLRPQVYQEVRRNDAVIQCDVCNRILYYVPPPPAPPAEGEAAPVVQA